MRCLLSATIIFYRYCCIHTVFVVFISYPPLFIYSLTFRDPRLESFWAYAIARMDSSEIIFLNIDRTFTLTHPAMLGGRHLMANALKFHCSQSAQYNCNCSIENLHVEIENRFTKRMISFSRKSPRRNKINRTEEKDVHKWYLAFCRTINIEKLGKKVKLSCPLIKLNLKKSPKKQNEPNYPWVIFPGKIQK